MSSPPRRTLGEVLDEIEAVARNHLRPRAAILELLDEARRTEQIKWEKVRPIKAMVMGVVGKLKANNSMIALMPDGSYMTTRKLVTEMLKIDPTQSVLNQAGRALGELGFIRMARSKEFTASRWYVPRALG